MQFRSHARELAGCPDFVFDEERTVVFCDGDFWHGRNWSERRAKLAQGHNADYWIAKIERNRRRDFEVSSALLHEGWTVIRIWESDILRDDESVLLELIRELAENRQESKSGQLGIIEE